MGNILGIMLDGDAHVISWGWFQITVANLVVVGLMVATFVAAIVIPFPRGKR